MKRVYIAGEDEVTREIIKRILCYCSPEFEIINSLPARGGQLKRKIKEFNNLSQDNPVILLADIDAECCAPIFKEKLLNGEAQNQQFLINIAVDEGEAWLMADRMNFATFLGINEDEMPHFVPKKQSGRKALMEIDLDVKTSYYLTHTLALQSSDKEIVAQIGTMDESCKGKEYNTKLLPFIREQWNISEAIKNSDSLTRMIRRINDLANRS